MTDVEIEVQCQMKKRRREEADVAERRGDELGASLALQSVPPPGQYASGRWPTTLRRALEGAEGPRARQDAEALERERWAKKAGEVVAEADLPLQRLAAETAHPEKTLIAGGTRLESENAQEEGQGLA